MKKYYIYLRGGLGNQLYQLSFANYLSKYLDGDISLFYKGSHVGDTHDKHKRNIMTELVEDLGFSLYDGRGYPLTLFRLQIVQKLFPFWVKDFHEPAGKHATLLPGLCQDLMDSNKGKTVNLIYGYFQCNSYQDLSFCRKIYKSLAKLSKREVVIPNEHDVAIHLRRGDFLKERYKIFYADYYLKGLNRLREECVINRVYVFSDDFEAIRDDLDSLSKHYNLVLVEGNTVIEDIVQMAQFGRFVLGNSTFSWWSAFMSESNGMTPRVVVPNQPLFVHNEDDQYYPNHWIKIE